MCSGLTFWHASTVVELSVVPFHFRRRSSRQFTPPGQIGLENRQGVIVRVASDLRDLCSVEACFAHADDGGAAQITELKLFAANEIGDSSKSVLEVILFVGPTSFGREDQRALSRSGV